MKHSDVEPGQRLHWRRRYRSGIGKHDWSTELVPCTVVRVAQYIVVVRCAEGERHVDAEKLEPLIMPEADSVMDAATRSHDR